ncbi:MAG: sigma-70 family RNA polymerase sigma factor [Acidobacteriota bacterium]
MEPPHAADLELASRCAAGDPAAWERFVAKYRPVLYRAADALDRGGGARDLADSLYAELYGVTERGRDRRSLLHYFHGRSSLATWLRAVLVQRHVDRIRTQRRFEPLPDEETETASAARTGAAPAGGSEPPDPARARYLGLVRQALGCAVGRLPARDRLRLAVYYVQELTLAETGRVLKEHEATVSRQLARTRRTIRGAVEQQLRDEAGLTDDQVAACFEWMAGDPGSLDLKKVIYE